MKEKSGTKRKRNLLQFIKFIRGIEEEKQKELCKKDERRSKLRGEISKIEIEECNRGITKNLSKKNR